jgi:hypothetical protein
MHAAPALLLTCQLDVYVMVPAVYTFLQKLLARHTPALQDIGNLQLQGYTVVITGPTRY